MNATKELVGAGCGDAGKARKRPEDADALFES